MGLLYLYLNFLEYCGSRQVLMRLLYIYLELFGSRQALMGQLYLSLNFLEPSGPNHKCNGSALTLL